MPAVIDLPHLREGLLEVGLLSIGCGIAGTWVVLRGLAFFSHAVGHSSFPGMVVAGGLGFARPLGAALAAGVFAASTSGLRRARPEDPDAAPALVLVAALAGGLLLARNVFHSEADVETVLFGSLATLSGSDLAVAGAASCAALGATLTVGPRWLATGFDPAASSWLRLSAGALDLALLALVAVVSIAVLATAGALLVGALVVIPAATARLWARTLAGWQAGSAALAAVLGGAGVVLASAIDVPPGPAIATLAGSAFAAAAGWRAISAR